MRFRVQQKEAIQLNLTPLIDVVFLLLIFFMLTTTFKPPNTLEIALPKASGAKANEAVLPIQIGVDKMGRYSFKQQDLGTDLMRLKMLLEQSLTQTGLNTPIWVVGDQQAPHQAVVSVLELANQLEITQLKILTAT
jgi:biopolymer transport protein ExbD